MSKLSSAHPCHNRRRPEFNLAKTVAYLIKHKNATVHPSSIFPVVIPVKSDSTGFHFARHLQKYLGHFFPTNRACNAQSL
eukprot:scaffold5781_cov209-Cylindrotheca_fusiformis.AAC.1